MRKLAYAVAGAAVAAFMAAPAWADHQPADKVAVSAAATELINCTDTTIAPGCGGDLSPGPITILSGELKVSTPTDLVLQVTLECALWTETKAKGGGNSKSTAEAGVVLFVEIDGVTVPVTNDADGNDVFNDPDDGRVVFCEREQELEVDLTGEGITTSDFIRFFERTKSSHGFNWIAGDPVGDPETNIHTVEVKAELTAMGSDNGTSADPGRAAAAIGKRTLVVEPTKLANDATF